MVLKFCYFFCFIICDFALFCLGNNEAHNIADLKNNITAKTDINDQSKIIGDHKNKLKSVLEHRTGHGVPQVLFGSLAGFLCACVLTIAIIFGIWYAYKRK
uniref:Uncharacterized protein n=1 Tax=Strongyloides stercoralis TaxID=6248 RepID=A0A0K0ET94_STRER